VLPWAFANLPALSLRQYAGVLYGFVVVLVLFSAGAVLNYWLDPDTVLVGLGEGKPVPVLRNHIRFSLMIVAALTAGGWLLSKRAYWSHVWERRLFGLGLFFLFVAIHIFSVRSALVALYAVMLFTVLRFLFLTRRWAVGIVALVAMLVVPLVAYQNMESLQRRVGYMRYDWDRFLEAGQSENHAYSDSERFISLEAGYRIWRAHPILGVGVGDLENEVMAWTQAHHPLHTEHAKLPHNQFLYTLTATGFLGLLLTLLAFGIPLADKRFRHFYVFLAFQIIVFISFLVEYTLETSIGAAFVAFYQLWWMRMGEATVQEQDRT
jgi:O-antigen ligase